MVKIVAIRNVLAARNSPECVCGRDSATDPAWGAYNAPLDPLVGWKGISLPIPHSRTPSASLQGWRLQRHSLPRYYEKSAPMKNSIILQVSVKLFDGVREMETSCLIEQ